MCACCITNHGFLIIWGSALSAPRSILMIFILMMFCTVVSPPLMAIWYITELGDRPAVCPGRLRDRNFIRVHWKFPPRLHMIHREDFIYINTYSLHNTVCCADGTTPWDGSCGAGRVAGWGRRLGARGWLAEGAERGEEWGWLRMTSLCEEPRDFHDMLVSGIRIPTHFIFVSTDRQTDRQAVR